MSNHLPWFPLYAGDFLLSRTTHRMTAEQVGTYMLLLMHEWLDGYLPNDVDEVAALGRCSSSDALAMLERCFTETEAGWYNERLEEIRDEQNTKRERLSRAGRKGGKTKARNNIKARLKPSSSDAKAMLYQSDTETDTEPTPRARAHEAEPKRTDDLARWMGEHDAPILPFLHTASSRDSFHALFGPPGMHPNAWRTPEGGQIPEAERPRLLATALRLYAAEGNTRLVANEFVGLLRKVSTPAHTNGAKPDLSHWRDD